MLIECRHESVVCHVRDVALELAEMKGRRDEEMIV